MRITIASLVAGLLFASSAQATVYTFEYTATIDRLVENVNGTLVPVTVSSLGGIDIRSSDSFTGTFSYDDANTYQTSQFVSPSYNKASYNDENIVFSMRIARTGHVYSSANTFIDVLDSRNPAKHTDSVDIKGSIYDELPGSSIYTGVRFDGTSTDVLHRARLPGEPLLAFEHATFSFYYGYYSTEEQAFKSVSASGNLASIKLINTTMPVSAVPEPGAYAMLLAGLGLVAWRGRRHRG